MSSSPSLLVLCLLSLVSVSYTSDLTSLLAFKSALTHDPSGILSNWTLDSDLHHCNWYGVTCDDSSRRVVSLNLTSSELRGTVLLSSSIGNLTELRLLSLSNNSFSGEVSGSVFGFLRSLEVVDLSRNSFSGEIPENLIGLPRIEFLDFSCNQFSEEIRISSFDSCSSLVYLKLSRNLLVGRIPPEIGKCRKLQHLLLDGNVLEGTIPGEIGQAVELKVFDISRNSLTGEIPRELGNCRNLSVLVLTKLVGVSTLDAEFNAFVGAIPPEILSLPNLEILWAPRANLDGQLLFDEKWEVSCKLRIFNLGQNYLSGTIPSKLGFCRNLTFLDLSSNEFVGSFLSPLSQTVGCMRYLNVSHNLISGPLPAIAGVGCSSNSISGYLEVFKTSSISEMVSDEEEDTTVDIAVVHDFSWNGFVGLLPSFSLPVHTSVSYSLFLCNNAFRGSFPGELFMGCKDLQGSFSLDLSFNNLSGKISSGLVSSCLELKSLNVAYNKLNGSIPSDFGDVLELLHLNLRGNNLSGIIPNEMGKLKQLRSLILGDNSLSGEIPNELCEMTSLAVLDLSNNSLMGRIPSNLSNVSDLQILLLDHNWLLGDIPASFSDFNRLTTLDVSFNNLSGNIPHLKNISNCNFFKGNNFTHPCPLPEEPSSDKLPSESRTGHRHRLEIFTVAAVASASTIITFLLVVMVVLVIKRRKVVIFPTTKRKVVVTFVDTPTELNYDNVIKATGNFSIKNLIGTGGFGSTFKAEISPNFPVAIKRLSLGRLQAIQQFDAEIRTLGRIRHRNLVTLIGYHMGETDTFLIYNYLPGGNLENFIHDGSRKHLEWSIIHKIALDVAQAMAYLHYSCNPRIVHRDIKPSNILLDEEHNAYLSDFGLARLLEVSETHATTDVAGTFGYVAPEYATTCRVSDKADVYSFGVVLLEMMSGKRSLDPSFSRHRNGFNIVTWAMMLIDEGRCGEFFATELWEEGLEVKLMEMLELASSCTSESLPRRPSMKQVVSRLKQLKSC